MLSSLFCIALGIVICVLGIRNMQGDISTLHSYHRSRVREEDVKPMGKLVGLGTIIIGVSVIIYSILLFVTLKTALDIFNLVGAALLIVGIVIGLVLNVYAMKKYNGGIF